jgi:DnaJ homolog subfamily C member 19
VIAKFLIAAAVIYTLWRLWHGNGPLPGTPRPPQPRPMENDEAEARATLGVDAAAGEREIRAAHRRLVRALHPDRGGSAELTRRINIARDTLLRD